MIASHSCDGYRPAVVARCLVRILTMLALLLAPLSMMGSHAAMAMTGAEAMASMHTEVVEPPSHCADIVGQAQHDEQSSPLSDCKSDCAVMCSAIPALGSLMAERPLMPAMIQPIALPSRVRGLHPESDDPPPRIA